MKTIQKTILMCIMGLASATVMAQLPNVGLVVDLNPGTNSGSASNLMKLGSTMIFSASDGSTGTELWKTDGTAAGTVLIKDIRPGTSSSSISNMRLMGSFVYFTANDGTNGGALWRTDGTTAGTTMVKDLNASTSSSSNITELTVIGNKLYFRGDDGVNGTEPWISDGSPSGTVMLKNIAPGSGSSSGFNCLSCAGTYEFVEFGGFVYFNANDFSNSGQQNSELWRTDGTTGGTVLFKDNYTLGSGGPANLVNAGSFLFFTSDNQSNTGYEPWKTDGTVGGTVMIKDIFTTANVGSITGDVSTAYMNGYVYFIAVDVYFPANFNLNPPQSGYINAELWRTDGTSGGTTKVKEINPGTTGLTADAFPFSTTNFLVFNNKLYFTATDGTNGMELWVSDGTSANTMMLKNIDTAGDASPSNLYAHNGFVYFSADDNAANGREIWRTDGTPLGTVLVKDINPGGPNSSPSNFTSLDATHLLFSAGRTIHGTELHILGGYTVAVTTSANGTVSPPGAVSTGNTVDMGFKSGASQTFTFAPGGGFNTQSVVVDGSSVGTPGNYPFNNITANHTLNVTFGTGAPTTFTINASAGAGGSISPSGAVSVNSGGSQAFTITPNSGFCIQSVLVNSINQGAISSYNFTNVTANQTISATFVAATTYYRDMDSDGFGNPSNTTTSCTGAPSGYVSNNTDCNDNNFNIKPSATEVCDGIDNNCNGITDEGAQSLFYRDFDSDGFGNPSSVISSCTQPGGYVANNTDCNDNSAVEKPGQIWYKDTDGDGYAQTGAATITQCTRPSGYRAASELTSTTGDCDDNNFNIKPSATEACDGIDNNCNGITDEGAQSLFYRDFDTDGFGNPSSVISSCTQPGGYVANNTDCNDNSAVEKPGQIWYKDTDGDGYAQTGAATITQCARPVGYKAASELTSTTGDCNDNNASINPAATEVCDGIDNDCDGSTDEGVLTTYYADVDLDGFGNPSSSTQACSLPGGYVTNNTDCNDNSAVEKPGQIWYKDTDGDGYAQTGAATITQCARPVGYKAATELTSTTGDCNDNNASINPAATEVCDGIDNDCDGSTDEGVLTTYYADVDQDGFGNPSSSTQACSLPGGYVTNNTDCNDNDALEKPGQIWYKDTDGDTYAQTGASTITQCLRPVGYKAASELTSTTGDCNDNNASINPAATEVCDGIDNDCDGLIDFNDPSHMDNTLPTLACASQATVVFNGESSIQIDGMNSPVDLQIQANDNCGIESISVSPSTINATQVGQTVPITITARDYRNNQATCITNVIVSGLPSGWSQPAAPVGCTNCTGNFVFNPANGTWTGSTTGATYNPTSANDAMMIASRTLCGDGSITALVSSISGVGWAGIFMRETNDPGAKKAQLMTNLGAFHRRDFRTTTNASATSNQINSNNRFWLRIVRMGNSFQLLSSADGTTFSFIASTTISMSSCIQMGLVATSINNTASTTTTFSNVSFTGSNGTLALPGGGVAGLAAYSSQLEVDFEVYPNPTNGELNVDLANYVGRMVRLEVYSLEGKLMQFSETDVVETHIQLLDMSKFHTGMYLIRVKSAGLPDAVQKVVLQRK